MAQVVQLGGPLKPPSIACMGIEFPTDGNLSRNMDSIQVSLAMAAEVKGLHQNVSMLPIPGMHMNTNVPSPGGMG
jgi:hypothetical protein